MGTQQMDKQLLEACAAAFRRARYGKNAPQSQGISLKEPGKPGSVNQSESAANGSSIYLQENSTVDTQQLSTSQEMFNRAKDSFMRLGLSESAAASAARGRVIDSGPSLEDVATSLQESQNAGDDAKYTEINQQQMTQAFMRLGFNEASAKQAAQGRGY